MSDSYESEEELGEAVPHGFRGVSHILLRLVQSDLGNLVSCCGRTSEETLRRAGVSSSCGPCKMYCRVTDVVQKSNNIVVVNASTDHPGVSSDKGCCRPISNSSCP